MKFNIDEEEVGQIRLNYHRAVQIDFIVKSQTFACFTDMENDGGLAPSSTFYKMDMGKLDQFLFWTSRPVVDPNTADYVFKEFFSKDGLTADSDSGQAVSPSATVPTKPRKRRYAYQHVKKYDVTKQASSDPVHLPVEYGILRLENDKDCLDSYGVEHLSKMEDGVITELGDLTDLNQPDKLKSLALQPFGVSKSVWLQAQGEFVKGDTMHQYTMVDKGVYEVIDEDENTKKLLFEGDKLNGIYYFNKANNQIEFITDEVSVKSYEISTHDIKDVYEQMGIVVKDCGCIMLSTQPIKVSHIISEDDLYHFSTDAPGYLKGFVSETSAHVTLLFGLMESGVKWKAYVDRVLFGLTIDTVKIEKVDFFPSRDPEEDYYCLIAKIEVTDELKEGNARLKMLPHIDTFPDYKPHVTLAYIKGNDVLRDEYITKLNTELAGQTLAVTGIDYGDE